MLDSIKFQRRLQFYILLMGLKSKFPNRPQKGWISEIRSLLLMTTAQLANRIGVAQSVMGSFEKLER